MVGICCCCCWSFQPHVLISPSITNWMRHPVSLWILLTMVMTSSCSARETRHSPAWARERRATLATPLQKYQRLLLGSRHLFRNVTYPSRALRCHKVPARVAFASPASLAYLVGLKPSSGSSVPVDTLRCGRTCGQRQSLS